MKILLKLFATAVLLASPAVVAQNVISSASGSFVRSSLAAASGAVTTGSPDLGTEIMFRNRSRVFGDRIVDGRRYWSVVDADVNGKSNDQVLQRLAPAPILARDGVRELDILVDVKRHLTVFTTPDRPVDIGTATVDAKDVRSISVTSIISASGLTIVTK